MNNKNIAHSSNNNLNHSNNNHTHESKSIRMVSNSDSMSRITNVIQEYMKNEYLKTKTETKRDHKTD